MNGKDPEVTDEQQPSYEDYFDAQVLDEAGKKIGTVGNVYLDDATGLPGWVSVRTGLFGTKESFVPLEQAILSDDKLIVPHSKQTVQDAPRTDVDKHLDIEEEARLFEYYGIDTDVALDAEPVSKPSRRSTTEDQDAG